MNIPAHIRNVVIPLGAPCIKMVEYVIHYQDSRYFAMFGKDFTDPITTSLWELQ
jgi:hypothetical protein